MQSTIPNKSILFCSINKSPTKGFVQSHKSSCSTSQLTVDFSSDLSQRLRHYTLKSFRKLSSRVGLSSATVLRATKRFKLPRNSIDVVHEKEKPYYVKFLRYTVVNIVLFLMPIEVRLWIAYISVTYLSLSKYACFAITLNENIQKRVAPILKHPVLIKAHFWYFWCTG